MNESIHHHNLNLLLVTGPLWPVCCALNKWVFNAGHVTDSLLLGGVWPQKFEMGTLTCEHRPSVLFCHFYGTYFHPFGVDQMLFVLNSM